MTGAHEPAKAAKERRTLRTRVSGSSMYARVPDFLHYMARGRYQPLTRYRKDHPYKVLLYRVRP